MNLRVDVTLIWQLPPNQSAAENPSDSRKWGKSHLGYCHFFFFFWKTFTALASFFQNLFFISLYFYAYSLQRVQTRVQRPRTVQCWSPCFVEIACFTVERKKLPGGLKDGGQQPQQIMKDSKNYSFFLKSLCHFNHFLRGPPFISGTFLWFCVDSESSRQRTLHPGIRAEKDRCESLSALTQRFEDQRLPGWKSVGTKLESERRWLGGGGGRASGEER